MIQYRYNDSIKFLKNLYECLFPYSDFDPNNWYNLCEDIKDEFKKYREPEHEKLLMLIKRSVLGEKVTKRDTYLSLYCQINKAFWDAYNLVYFYNGIK